MKIRKGSVYIQDWMRFHPITKQSTCDSYYLGLSKEVFKLLQNDEYESLISGLDDDDLKDFACFLTCYLEDIISKTGIWQAFTSAHFELYNKYLPFYKLDEYYHDEINPQDIQFLIWYFINGKFLEEYLSPVDKLLLELSYEIYEIFDREFETAPENMKLKSFISISPTETNYYKVRNLMDWIFISSYLFHFQEYEFEAEMENIIKENDENVLRNLEAVGDDYRDYLSTSKPSSLLAYRGNHWLARVLGKNHPLYEQIFNLEKRIIGFFIYKGEEEKNIILQHIATDKIIKVTKKSIDVMSDFKVGKTIILINLMKWNDEWWFSGSYTTRIYDEKFIKEEKQSTASQKLFIEDSSVFSATIEREYFSFLKYNNNKQIAFCENVSKLNDFINGFLQFHHSSINTNVGIAGNADEKMKEFKLNTEGLPEDFEQTNGIVFYDRKEGMSVILELSDAIPDESNTSYNSDSKADILDYIYSPYCKPGTVKFLAEKYPVLIEKYEKNTHEHTIAENLDFLLRFKKYEMYDN
jgi:hypothetical protein